ncbi:MAG TPA: TonB-dependent receptor [bacterium]|nr:TonB-dependent receptor [bacterium]
MRGNHFRAVIAVLAVIFVLKSPLWSATTGKIAGTVIDTDTGDPLAGVNVVVLETGLGAAADLEGRYTILHVPPGEYTVQFTMIGYSRMTVSEVRVRIDQTTRIDVGLQMEAVEGQTVTIVAERTPLKVDVATSVVSVSGREVQDLPVSTIEGVVGMQAGVQGGLNIRGSGGEAALLMLDGITMRDPRNNQPISKIALSAVKEINIERGGFNAEYGQVQSGLVNVVTYEGRTTGYFGSLTGKITPPAPKYYRGNSIPDVHDPDSYWMRPYLDDDVCWTGTNSGAWDVYTRSKYLEFNGWNAVSERLMTDNDPDNDLTPLAAQRVFLYQARKEQPNDQPDYEIDGGFGGPVPFISEPLGGLRFFTSYRRHRNMLLWPMTRPDNVNYDATLQLTSDISNSMKLRISGAMGKEYTMENNWAAGHYFRSPNDIAGGTGGNPLFNMFSDWALCLADLGYRSVSGKLTHILSGKMFYEISLDHVRRSYHTRPTALRDTSTLTEVVPGFFMDENPIGYWPATKEGIVFGRGEQASLARDFSRSSATTLRADLTSQVNYHNLVKAGIELIYNDLDLDYGFIQMQTEGKTYANRVQMRNFPVRGALYVQDKLETKGFTMNAGLRLDYSNSQTDWWDVDPYEIYFISSRYSDLREFDMKSSKGQWQLSPRLGIAHPITENSKLFFNYGHFKQMPQYETLFRVDRTPQQKLRRLGDPNLILAKTISYELGYDHILPYDVLFQVAAFYRDITDQQNTTHYFAISGDDYYLTTSNHYEDIRGFELTLRKTAGRWFSGFANYTYQVSTRGNFGREQVYQDPSLQKRWDENTVNLYQERPIPSPYARANLSFYSPVDFGPRLMGHAVFGGFMVNLLLDWSQGGWTTYNPKGASGVSNNVQFVDYFNATLRASKTIAMNRIRLQFLVDVGNLFNSLRLRNTWEQEYRMSLHLPESKAYDNIPGNDKLGDYRKPGVEWQPMEYRAAVDRSQPSVNERVIYYEGTSGTYWQYTDGAWGEVSQARIDQINKDKAYINMPNPSTYWFLNPRAVVFGARLSFDLN